MTLKKLIAYRIGVVFVVSSGMTFGLAISLIIQSNFLGGVFLASIFGLWTVWLSSLARVLTTVVTGIAVTGLLLSIYNRLPIVPELTTTQDFLVLLLVFLVLSVRPSSESIRTVTISGGISDLASSVTALLLISRWPMRTASQYLSFLSYEDNAAWIRSASRTLGIHYEAFSDSGYGAAPSLDRVLSALRVIGTSLGGLRDAPSSSYQLVGMTYAFLNIIGMVAVGLTVSRKINRNFNVSRDITNALPTVLTTLLVYISLQFPATTGHLTFVGALVFLWTLLLVQNNYPDKEINDSRSVLIRAVIAIGAAGMWWPLAIVVVPYLFVLLSESQVKKIIHGFLRQNNGKAALVIVGTTLVFVMVVLILGAGFSMLTVREFLQASGGVQPVPGNSLLICLLIVGIFAALASRIDDFSLKKMISDETHILLLLVASVGLLVIASYFIGPSFTPNYASNKLTLFAVMFCIPLTASALLMLSGGLVNVRWSALSACAVFLVGTQSFGWNANIPRDLVKPTWTDKLIEIADENPRSMILCTTADPGRNFDAYLCSRHALELQYQRHSIGNAWRNLQVNPGQDSANEERSMAVRDGLSKLLDEGTPLIILSLEPKFDIAQEDAWWMNGLPFDRMTTYGVS